MGVLRSIMPLTCGYAIKHASTPLIDPHTKNVVRAVELRSRRTRIRALI